MAGKGTEVGRPFRGAGPPIIDAVELDEKVGVCLDTCHVWDGGYDIAGDLDGVLEEFDRVIGLDRLRAIHLNDSKNPLGAHKDRHAPIGRGLASALSARRCDEPPGPGAICPSSWKRPRTTFPAGAAKSPPLPGSACRVAAALNHEEVHAKELQAAGGQHEQVKNRVHVTHLFEDVEHGAHGIADAAGN